MDAPPIIQPAPPPPRSGCFAKGCLVLLIAGFVFLLGIIGLGWFVINHFIATEPRAVQMEEVSSQEMQAAEAKMDTLRAAIRNKEETTLEFSAADLNALVANDPGFSDARGRVHFAIANSTVSLELSVPLASTPWKRFRSRWFNGRVRFGLSYVDEQFSFDMKSAEANGHAIPAGLFSAEFSRSFNRSFNDSFRRASRQHRDDLWRHLKMISVQDDKLIVTTRGP
jgi:hypothetical protein